LLPHKFNTRASPMENIKTGIPGEMDCTKVSTNTMVQKP
jgi:hypothetical protein